MERRELIKGLAALGAMALLPNIVARGNQTNRNLHFVGLGQGGTNAMVFIHQEGIKAKYSCITGPYVSYLTPKMEHLFFETPPEYRVNGIRYKKQVALTPEMKAIFSEDDRYIILTGLGASVGTGLISNLLEFLRTELKTHLAICSLPSINEGRSKRVYAIRKMDELEKLKNVLSFDQQLIAEDVEKPSKPSILKILEKAISNITTSLKHTIPSFLINSNSIDYLCFTNTQIYFYSIHL